MPDEIVPSPETDAALDAAWEKIEGDWSKKPAPPQEKRRALDDSDETAD